MITGSCTFQMIAVVNNRALGRCPEDLAIRATLSGGNIQPAGLQGLPEKEGGLRVPASSCEDTSVSPRPEPRT